MEFESISISELLEITSSKSPTPGGGSIAALTGALSTALASMVCNLTLNNIKYNSVQDIMLNLVKKFEKLQIQLLDAAQEDTECFNELMVARAMPQDTPEEKDLRKRKLYQLYKDAIMVPLNIARTAVDLLPAISVIIKDGNKNAVTDALIAAMLARTSVLSAIVNVRFNLKYIEDYNYVKIINEECDILERYAIDQELYIASVEPSIINLDYYSQQVI